MRYEQTGIDAEGSVAIGTLLEAIQFAVEREHVDDVLAILTGAFVGLTIELVRREGHDVNKEITVDGGTERNITIHAPKELSHC